MAATETVVERVPEPFGDVAPKPQRVHHLDALRAWAMLLLVPYHATRGTMKAVLNAGEGGGAYQFSTWFVHSWHMPLFFLLSGFLAAGALRRAGNALSQARERISRVGIPLAIGVLMIIPALNVVVNYWANLGDKRVPPQREWDLGNIFNWRTQHFWFLDYLLVGTLIVLAIWVAQRHAAPLARLLRDLYEGLVDAWWLTVPALALVNALLLSTFPDWHAPPTSDSLVPKPALLAYYMVFFSFGFMLAGRQWLLKAIEAHPLIWLAIAFAVTPFAYELFHQQDESAGNWGAHLLALYLNGLLCWSMLFAIWAVFARLFRHPSPFWRYLADASLWIFMIHVLFIAGVQGWLANHTEVGRNLSLLIVTTAGVLGSLLTWELFLRGNRAGDFLAGKRRKPRPRLTATALADGASATR